ncbi:putative enzymatic polyprotein [Sesamum angolense]|uniref:Enzymatic polyprotein n=1 Tax=Sesamum angolense TaxID=2727404 RepID=A0AAE2BHW3_9LAMI|nr:putative enzymatic polyprotein [Sesamum angolense]
MDLQPSQNNYSEEDRFQTSESLSGFFSRMTVSKQNYGKNHASRFQPQSYDGFRIGGLLIPKEEILEELVVREKNCRKLMFDIHPRIAYNLADQDFSRVLTLHQDFKKKRSNERRKEYIEIPRIFKEFAKVMTPDPIRIPRIGDVDIVIKDHPVLDRTMSSRTEFSSRMSFSEDRIIGYKGKEKDLSKVLTPQEIRVLQVEKSFLEDHKPWGRKGNGMEFSLDGVTIRLNDKPFSIYISVMNMEDKKDMQMIIKEHINLGLIEPRISAYSSPGFLIKMESELKKFTAFSTPQGQYIWNVLPMGLANAPQIFQRKMDNLFKDYFEFMFVYIDDILIVSKNMKEHIKHLEIFSDACYKEGLVLSEKKATIAVNKIEFLGILIDETCIELQEHIVEKIRNFPDILKDKKHLQSFLGVVNFAGIFIKDLAKYRKDFRPLLKETESAKWKWEEIHTQRVRELKQVCNNLPKLAIPQDEDELVVYTDANDYRWAACS